MKTPSLKPCPFCFAEAPILRVLVDKTIKECSHCSSGRDFAVCCDAQQGGCGATGGYRFTKQAAVDLWNMRGPTTTKIKRGHTHA